MALQGLMSAQDWEQASGAALALFNFGQQEAAKRDLLLVDTKYEFGKDSDGNIMLIDEVGGWGMRARGGGGLWGGARMRNSGAAPVFGGRLVAPWGVHRVGSCQDGGSMNVVA